MQEGSSNFVEAASGAARLRTDQLLIDWSGDGLGRAVVLEEFDRTVVNHWNRSTSGHLWNLNGDGAPVLDADWDVPGNGTGTISLPIAPAYRLTLLITESYGDEDFNAEFNCPAASGANLVPSLLVGGTTAQTYLTARFNVVPGGSILVELIERLDGVETILGQSTSALTHSASTWYAVRWQRYGAEQRVRLWEAGTREPIERWDLQVTYTGTIGLGFPGVRFGAATGNLNAKPVSMSWRGLQIVNGELDDWTTRMGAWDVDHHLDDGMPDEVSFVAGTAVPTLRAGVIRPGHVSGRGRFTNREFFSPFNTDSPIYGFERDIPPVTLESGVVTEDGPERIRVFTGQMQDLRMIGGTITLHGSSSTRLALAKLVQLPAVYGFYEGANATWAISYALAACGIYASPPPQEGCRLWIPMHGSIRSFIPATNNPQLNLALHALNDVGVVASGGQHIIDLPWIEGPYVNAPELFNLDGVSARIDIIPTGTGIALEPGTSLVAQDGSSGKLEMWVKCDAATDDTVSIVRMILNNANGTGVDCIVPPGTRLPAMFIDDNTTVNQFIHSQPLPTDGEWHFLGFAWRIDGANSKRWITIDDDEESDTGTTFLVAGLPATEAFADDHPRLLARIPIAELQMTAGDLADPDAHPWLNQIPFTPGAQVEPSLTNLVSIAERTPREAWELITSYAMAELAMFRIDENDIARYLGYTWWGRAAQQVVVDQFDTAHNMAAPDVEIDSTKIRNAASITFSEGFNIDLFAQGMSVFDVYTIDLGVTEITLPTDMNIVEIRGYSFTYIATATTTEPTSSNYVSLNLAADGSSSYATSSEVTVAITDWTPGQVTIRFTNLSGAIWYTANNKSFATIGVAGKLLDLKQRTVTEYDDDSVAARGERGLGPLALPALQRPIDARRTARRLVNDLSRGVPVIKQTTVRGDSRRQPGDLVQVTDRETAVDGNWRVHSVYHSDDTKLYTQRVTLRRARQGGYWGIDFIWGESIWTSED